LIGVVEEDGRVANIRTPLPVDAGFLGAAAGNGPPEQRFRFSSPCVEGHCSQWDGQGCGLIDRVLGYVAAADTQPPPAMVPRCAIRASCRWWQQIGAPACAVCPLVITDAGKPEAEAALVP
jgi:hypothetical protein